MKNTLIRFYGSDNTKLEIRSFDTNSIGPYGQLKECGIVVYNDNYQYDFDINEDELEELLSFLMQMKSYITNFNKESRAKEPNNENL